MIMQNTTFYIPVDSRKSFIECLKREYLRVLDDLGYKGRYNFWRLMVPHGFEDEEETYAVSVLFDTKEQADEWIENKLVEILDRIYGKFGKPGNPLYYISIMEDVV